MRMLIESWKAQRAMLAHQLEMFESGGMSIGADDRNIVVEETKRLSACIAELDALLKEHDHG
jgi:hypothetical protein